MVRVDGGHALVKRAGGMRLVLFRGGGCAVQRAGCMCRSQEGFLLAKMFERCSDRRLGPPDVMVMWCGDGEVGYGHGRMGCRDGGVRRTDG